MAVGYKENEIIIVKGKESAIKLREEERQTLNEMKQLISEHKSIPQQRVALRLAAMAKSSLPGTARHTHNDG